MRKRQTGFTLLELMVVVGIAALLLGLGIPALSDFIRNSRLTAAANDLLVDLNLARNEAIKRSRPVTVCATSTPEALTPDCNGGRGWVVFEDDNGNGSFDVGADQRLAARDALPQSVFVRSRENVATATPSLTYVSYAPSGFRRTITNAIPTESRLLLCDVRGNKTVGTGTDGAAISAARLVQVSVTGRALVTRSVSQINSDVGGCP